ncbi:MAG: DNA polymerase III subunit beta [Candidatus Eisenbacteria bacterium RBG_16_71_46]|nr:MAG: DNA polymerase III subunit beta [Candidatus Eisenbacteria bacterium RBG_16_71_46]OGF25253.1 MAG: DNA polymerase III subunit beta [Candidatus Eisenbacteria bacterium RBG_19FT_COMBO_70_11]
MQLTIQQADLAFAVGRALGSVSSKSPLPLLSCILLEAEAGSLRITGTDLDVTTAVTVPCTVATPGRVAVSARHFNEVVRKMPRGPLVLSVTGGQCEVRYGDGKGWSKFPIQDAADFPRIPDLKADTRVSLGGDVLSRMVARTIFSASSEETRPMLNGVLVQGGDKQAVFVATDGHRLSKATRKGAFSGLAKDGVIVPTRAFQTVSRIAEEATSPVELQVAGARNQAAFTAQVGEYRVQVLTRLLEGPYPNYEQVIPRGNPREMRVRRSDLMEAVDIVASHADNVTRQVRFSLRPGRIGVSSATELGAGEHQLDAQYAGEAMEIGYNAGYLMEILRSIPTEEVVFRLNTSLAAGVIEPVGALPEAEEEMLCLIMPLRLPDAAG